MSSSTPVSEAVAEVVDLYSGALAAELYDEEVTEADHALQAARLAEEDGAGDELVVAALLHDVGHLIAGDLTGIGEPLTSDAHHEGVGARWLRPRFGDAVARPVALHVEAKRFLCAVDDSYLGSLSPSSVRSLEVQGGPMDAAEAERFRSNRSFADSLRLRRWDDLAKVAGAEVPDMGHHLPRLERLAGFVASTTAGRIEP